jgi:hypothetical protein
VSALVTLGVVPIIRCPRGGAAEHVASVLEGRLRDLLKGRSNLFSEGAGGGAAGALAATLSRPLLVLFDRNFDLAVMLQHAWSYKPLVQVRRWRGLGGGMGSGAIVKRQSQGEPWARRSCDAAVATLQCVGSWKSPAGVRLETPDGGERSPQACVRGKGAAVQLDMQSFLLQRIDSTDPAHILHPPAPRRRRARMSWACASTASRSRPSRGRRARRWARRRRPSAAMTSMRRTSSGRAAAACPFPRCGPPSGYMSPSKHTL